MPYEEDQPNEKTYAIIPKPRGNRAQRMSYVLLALCAFILYLIEQNFSHILRCLIVHFTALQAGSLLKGICNFAEEMDHVTSRYHGSYGRALSACLDLRRHALCFVFLCGVAYFLCLEETGLPVYLNLTLMSLCQLLSIIFGIQHPSAAEISEIHEQNNCNVAQGLAWSYYIGYLKVILPSLKDLISDFNRSHGELLTCKKTWKLHILIPLSCDVYDDLQKVDSHIQFINNLPELRVDRAGVKQRSYKNSVYGILGEDQKMNYCVLEYATPLKSLYAMSQDENAGFSSQDRLEQAKLFCRTLEEILQKSKECSDCYRLIVYDDSENNDTHCLSKALLGHIRQQHQEEYNVHERLQGCIESENLPSNGTQLLLSGSDQPQPLHSF
ncbi:stimulator of interferon genes protein [Elgaria multicarinata webbii]|uniref:stimulator of interferon genes protein n=1 Tax=Elgaria multicarinata webbii TaxID=159646 RepID=UPI002FCD02BC